MYFALNNNASLFKGNRNSKSKKPYVLENEILSMDAYSGSVVCSVVSAGTSSVSLGVPKPPECSSLKIHKKSIKCKFLLK